MKKMKWCVICKSDFGLLTTATQRLFDTKEDAQKYAATVHPARKPSVHQFGAAMKLKSLGANKTEITLPNGAVIFFSYQTPVAAQLAEGGFVKTETKYSVTTSKHITQWLDGANAKIVPQSVLDSMVS